MSNIPPSHPQVGGTMRIGPFWKRASEMSPSALSPSGDEPFDALTDLFLGEVAGARIPGASKTPGRNDPARSAKQSRPTTFTTPAFTTPPTPPLSGTQTAPQPGDGPILRLAGTEDGVEYQLAPAPVVAGEEAITTRAASPVLTLADDEQGEARPITDLLPPPARNPVLELLVLGNLPVVAGAWASQYVREIAEAAGKPVAYLRMQGEFASLEVIGALADVAGAPGLDDLASLDDAIDAAAAITDRWIVRCEAGHEATVAGCSITRAVTILTGGDQMAREACRVALVGLAGRLPAPSADGPMLRLAVMGGQNAAMGAELAAMASATLARPVAAVLCAGKIGGVRPPHPLFSGSTELTLKTILSGVERSLVAEPVGTEMFARPEAVAASAPTVIEDVAAEVECAPIEETRAGRPCHGDDIALPEPKPTTAEIAVGHAQRREAAAEPVQRVERETTVAATVSPAAAMSVSEPVGPVGMPAVQMWSNFTAASREAAQTPPPSVIFEHAETLASHLVDLHSTALRCPYASGIEVAIDGSGRLHLLARSKSESSEESTLAALLIASSWAEQHSGLLASSLGKLSSAARPTLHLFTDKPKHSRRLLETNLRVHLLAEVNVGAERTWFCTDLN